MKPEEIRLLMKDYETAPDDTVFSQATVAAVRRCSIFTVERDRWAGTGVPFRKMGRLVRYYKCDIQQWLAEHPVLFSTSQYPKKPKRPKKLKETKEETELTTGNLLEEDKSEE